MCDNLPLDGLVIIRAAACWAEAVHVRPDVVEAELAYLEAVSIQGRAGIDAARKSPPYLVSTRAWPKVAVGEIELLDAERAVARVVSGPKVRQEPGVGMEDASR